MKSKVAFHDVEAEKAIAIAMKKYRRHQKNFKSSFQACFVIASVFFVISRFSSWLPTNAGFSADFFRPLQKSDLTVFLLFNALIAAIFALKRQNVKDESGAEATRSPDFYHEFAIHSEYYRSMAVGGLYPETEMAQHGGNVVVVDKYPETEMTPEESFCEESFCQDFGETCQRHSISSADTFELKQKTKCWANAVVPFPPVDDKRTVTETKSSFVPPVRAITGNCTENDDALVEKRYRRTQSESRASQSVYQPKSSKKFMQRSETEIHRKKMSCRGEPARKSSSVEELDDEEFQRKVQKFIDRNKETQKKEIEREKKERERIAMEERRKEEERRKTEEFQEKIDKFINKMKQSHKEECRKESERRRRTEGNYINRAVL